MRVSGLIRICCLLPHNCLQSENTPIHYRWRYCLALVAHPRYRLPSWRVRYLGTTSPPSFGTAQQLPLDSWVRDHYIVPLTSETTQSRRVMSILIPTALFSALDNNSIASQTTTIPSDELRAQFLRFSRGTAVVLLVMWVSGLPYCIRHLP